MGLTKLQWGLDDLPWELGENGEKGQFCPSNDGICWASIKIHQKNITIVANWTI